MQSVFRLPLAVNGVRQPEMMQHYANPIFRLPLAVNEVRQPEMMQHYANPIFRLPLWLGKHLRQPENPKSALCFA